MSKKSQGRFFRYGLTRLISKFKPEPEDKTELHTMFKQAHKRGLLDNHALAMIEGVLRVSELRVRDIMVPRGEMDVIRKDDRLEEILPEIIETAHSRYPVIDEDKADVEAILLAKDLLQSCTDINKNFNIRDYIRPAKFVPESKRLNVLLQEFRKTRNHIAIVIDEYGATSGLVTIEDVLEEIVGEIEDEHDLEDDDLIQKKSDTEFTIKAQVEIEDFNEYFHVKFNDEDVDTLAGLVTRTLGHMPRTGESVVIENIEFRILSADSRKVRLLEVRILK